MAINKASARLQHHSLTTPGSVFTVPATDDFTDGSWAITDLVVGELGINLADDRAFIRTINGIVELHTTSVISGLWKWNGDDIEAQENGLTSPVVYPNILGPGDNLSDLGSSSIRWKDLYLGGDLLLNDGTIDVAFIDISVKAYTFGTRSAASGEGSFVTGGINDANGATAGNSFATGESCLASGLAAFACGYNTTASNTYAHAEGSDTSATGVSAHAEGGGNTTASGNYSHAEGWNCVANDTYAHAEGYGTLASASRAHAEGDGTTASGLYSHAEGNDTTASGQTSHAEGQTTTASATGSHAGGIGALANHYAEWARSSITDGATYGLGQYGIVSYARETTDATPVEIFLDGTFNTTGTLRLTLASEDVYRVVITAVATDTATGDAKEWLGYGIIKNIAGTTSLVGGTITMSSSVGDAGLATASIATTADDTNDSLKLAVTGIAATTIKWFAKVNYTKIEI